MTIEDKKEYSYSDVCSILCDACDRNVNNYYDWKKAKWMHEINEIRIACDANDWKKRARDKAYNEY